MGKNKSGTNFILAAAVFFAGAMVIFPDITESGSKTAIIIWANSIVPILLPFFIFADFIKRTGNPERLPKRIYPFVLAFLSGYPVGAKATSDLVSCGRLSPEEAEKVLSYSLVTGPAFIIGTIGAFLGSYKAAGVIAAAHYAGAVLNGLLYRTPKMGKRKGYGVRAFSEVMTNRSENSAPKPTKNRRENSASKPTKNRHGLSEEAVPATSESFTAAILSGFRSMAVILAYLILFMIAIDLIEATGALDAIKNETAASFLKGIFEMTVGAKMISLCDINLRLKTALISFVVSFGGFSVIGQSVSMTSGSGIGSGTILKIKLTHGLLAGIISVILSWAVL